MEWNRPPDAELLNRLTPAQGVIDMVLDTDAYNEVDDQFALCYALLSPERLNVRAVYAAPFFNDRSSGPADGMEKSYREIVRLLGKLGRKADGFALKGSDAYLPDGQTPVDSPAARDLVKRARGYSPQRPLTVVAIGAITNVASALLMAPDIARNISIVWLGGNPMGYPTAREFNLMQDVPAVRVLLDCCAPLTIIPCMGVSSHLLTTPAELRAAIGGKNAVCDALVELFCAYQDDHFGWAKEIWDISTVAYLINPEWVPCAALPSPLLTDDCHWAADARRHPIKMAYFCYRNPIFRDLFEKLGRA